ncbi:MAG: hypothetical protein J1E39_01895 [Eubacterium sp.]|nr:hypothetical protein [Eubacterium sp.]
MLLFLVLVILLPILAVALDGVYEAVTAETKTAARDYNQNNTDNQKRAAVIERINLDRETVRRAS